RPPEGDSTDCRIYQARIRVSACQLVKRKPRPPKKVFLSYATRDRRFADRVARLLRKSGVPVWYSRSHLRGAQQWQQEIGAAVRRCDWLLIILSPAAVKSMWVKRELFYALNQKRYEN